MQALNTVKKSAQSTVETVDLAMKTAEVKAEARLEGRFDTNTRVGRAAQTGTVLTVVSLGITIIMGILVYDKVAHALPLETDSKDYANNTNLENAASNSTGTFADSMELAPVIMIVLLAAVVLAVVQRFR